MSVQQSLGAMLQGVSQQPNRIRKPGQVTEQVNLVSDVATGLSSRAGTVAGGELPGATSATKFRDIKFGSTIYQLGFSDSSLQVWDLSGTPQVLQGGDNPYIKEDMQFHVVVDKDNVERAYCTNRTTRVQMSTEVSSRSTNVGIVTALGGAFSRKYYVTWELENGDFLFAEYETPDGSDDGDALNSSSGAIIDGLFANVGTRRSTEADDPPADYPYASTPGVFPAGVTVQKSGDVLLVEHPSSSMDVTVEDGDAGNILRGMSDTVRDIVDLPNLAPHGTVVLVSGDAASEDDYYLEFVVDGGVAGQNFGTEGVWRESAAPGIVHSFDVSTMPHALERLEDGTFSFSVGDWQPRRVGDEDTVPLPSFVGRTIRDVGSFESRLVFLSGSNFITSRSRHPTDFFKKSATVLSDSDPIDETSTKEGSAQLDWIVPFDRDLLLLSDPGSAQFVVAGGGLTPSNASMVLTTSYQMEGNTRPVTTGRTVIFPFLNGKFSGIKEFFTNDTVSTNGADTLTEVQSKYIPGVVRQIASSENFNILLVLSDIEKSSAWVYKYLWDGGERLQSSWSKWEFSEQVEHVFFDNSVVYITTKSEDKYYLSSLDMNKPVDTVLGYHPSLDRKEVHTVQQDGESFVELSYKGAKFIQYTGCASPGVPASPHRELTVVTPSNESFAVPVKTYRYYFSDVPPGASLMSGKPLKVLLVPSMPLVKDRLGATVSSASLVVNRFMLHVQDTGDIRTLMTSPYREDFEFIPYVFPMDDDPLDPTRVNLRTHSIEVPWGEDANFSELTVLSDDVRPVTILELEWEGNITGRKRRE